jgi:hypothetical protein
MGKMPLGKHRHKRENNNKTDLKKYIFGVFYLVCEAIGTAATPGLLCQPRVIVKMIVEKLVE